MGKRKFPLPQGKPYNEERSKSCGDNFWNKDQEVLYDDVYSRLDVFHHKYVDWSALSNPGNDALSLSTKYANLGLRDLVSSNPNWDWDVDVVRKFYATLFVWPGCKGVNFMIDSKKKYASKKDFEDALRIQPRDDSVVLHASLSDWKDNDANTSSLYLVPTTSTKKVRDLKPEVDLIQKINRRNLLPRVGNRGSCSDIGLRLAHAIYHGIQFDVAHFLFSEMLVAKETPDHELPYAPYIFCLLRHMNLISNESIVKGCFLKKYTPSPDSVTASIRQLSEQMEKFENEVIKRFEVYDKKFKTIEKEVEDFKKFQKEEVERYQIAEKRYYGLYYKRRSGSGAAADP